MTQQSPVRRVSFVVPVKNDAGRLRSCLEAIWRNRREGLTLEIIVADNGSTDTSVDVAEAAGARVLRLPSIGVSELRNRAAATATGEALAFVDADHVIASSWLPSAAAALSDERVGAAGAVYSAPTDGTWVQHAYGALRGKTIHFGDTAWLGSGNLVVRRTAFEAIHGFDTSLDTCEDVDLCQRLRAAGWRVVSDPGLESVHLGDPPTLGALFRAERWRGRDNLRVSLRGHMALRDLPSVFIPVIDLAAGIVALWALVTVPRSGAAAMVTLTGVAALVLALAATRVLRAFIGGRLGVSDVPRAFVVSLTWDVARAFALVWPAPHHRHRKDARTRSGAALT